VAIELLCRKLGMTQIFLDTGECAPVTVLDASPNTVVDKKTEERDHYSALQLGSGENKESRFGKAELGHFKANNASPQRVIRESRVTAEEAAEYEIGQEITCAIFEEGQTVDVIGTSKGRGFTGVVKRHGMKIKKRTHGTHEAFRHGGSIGAGATPGHVIKGMKMAGQQGNARVTTKNLKIVKIDAEKNLIFVRGGVPGHNDALVCVRRSLSGK
jgi:large subunit ribosomal protein L3